MATLATAQFWVRTDGADANGGGYDSGIASAVTNYSNQASPQATWSQLTLLSGTLTDPLSGGLFTTAMIGNAINVPGQGYYWVTAITTANIATVTPGTGATTSFTTQPGKLGGAFRNPSNLSNGGSVSAPGTTTTLVPGNIINLRASGSGSVGSPDYSQSGYATYPNGDSTNGAISWIAYNGTPYIVGNGLCFYQISGLKFKGIYFSASSNSNGSFGLLNVGSNCVFTDCTVDMNNQLGQVGFYLNDHNIVVVSTEIKGGGSSSGDCVSVQTYGSSFKDCNIHGGGGWGINEVSSNSCIQLSSCAIWNNVSGGIKLNTIGVVQSSIDGCTINNNISGPGIKVASTAVTAWVKIINNNITTNGTYGIDVATGSANVNTRVIAYEDYNNFGSGATLNVSGAYNNLNGGAHDINVDPGYANASAGQFTPSNTALIATAPIGFA